MYCAVKNKDKKGRRRFVLKVFIRKNLNIRKNPNSDRNCRIERLWILLLLILLRLV
jgi:hypothetical protein